MEKSNELKPKKNDPVLHVSLSEDEMIALLSMLNLIKEEDISETRQDGKQAEKIMDVIFRYRKRHKKGNGSRYTLSFFESQSAALIRFFAKTVRMINPHDPDSSEDAIE